MPFGISLAIGAVDLMPGFVAGAKEQAIFIDKAIGTNFVSKIERLFKINFKANDSYFTEQSI